MSNGKIIYESLTEECKAIVNNIKEYNYDYFTEIISFSFLSAEHNIVEKVKKVEPDILFSIFGYSVVRSNTLKLKREQVSLGSIYYKDGTLDSKGELRIGRESVMKNEYRDLFLYFKDKSETEEKAWFNKQLNKLTEVKVDIS